MKPLFNKILYEVLPDSEQPQKTMFGAEMDKLKKCQVIDIGSEVTEVKIGQIITIYINDMNRLDDQKGFCIERSVLFKDDVPMQGKVHITDIQKDPLSQFTQARVVSSGSSEIQDGSQIFYKAGQSHILPDDTELLSQTQIFYTKKD